MNIPNHLGIILDGNRRWAKERGLSSFEGHRKGLEKVKKIVNWSRERGIKTLTLFVFSTENWKRAKSEVNFLMTLAKKALTNDLEEYANKGVKIRVIGQREKLSADLQKEITKIEGLTKDNKDITLNLALSYGGRTEIVEAVKNIVRKKISPEKITEEVIKENLWTSDVDLIIRTGKEQRISNFLIWQAAYSELYFCPKYWPDFNEMDLDQALAEYSSRQRRFGK
jgi:undecaprenyl diphosphate synthase